MKRQYGGAERRERQLTQEDVVDERKDDDERHPLEVGDALPAEAAAEVLVVRTGDRVNDGGAQVSGVRALRRRRRRRRRRPARGADVEQRRQRDDGEQRERERGEEDAQRDDVIGEQLRRDEQHGEERDDVDADERYDAVLPRAQTADVAVDVQHAGAAANVDAVEQRQRALRHLLVRVEEERHDGEEDTHPQRVPQSPQDQMADQRDRGDDGVEVQDEGALEGDLRRRCHPRQKTRPRT